MKLEELSLHLRELRLPTILKEFSVIARQCEKDKPPYEQYLASLLQVEITERRRKKSQRLLREAKLPVDKDLEDFDFDIRTGITRAQAFEISKGDFLQKAENIVFYGSFGVGKSHLAMAIGKKLCLAGYRCLFLTTQGLITILLEAQNDLKLSSAMKRLDKFDLIILDELGYTPQSSDGADLFFQFISDRYERKSILITTNLTYSEWDKVFLNRATTQAAIDRIIHRCQTYNLKGPSFRAQEAQKRGQDA